MAFRCSVIDFKSPSVNLIETVYLTRVMVGKREFSGLTIYHSAFWGVAPQLVSTDCTCFRCGLELGKRVDEMWVVFPQALSFEENYNMCYTRRN